MTRFLPGAPDPHRFDPDPPAREIGAVGVLLINLGTPDEPRQARFAGLWRNSWPAS